MQILHLDTLWSSLAAICVGGAFSLSHWLQYSTYTSSGCHRLQHALVVFFYPGTSPALKNLHCVVYDNSSKDTWGLEMDIVLIFWTTLAWDLTDATCPWIRRFFELYSSLNDFSFGTSGAKRFHSNVYILQSNVLNSTIASLPSATAFSWQTQSNYPSVDQTPVSAR